MSIKEQFEKLQEKEMELFYKSIRGEASKSEHASARLALENFYHAHASELND